MTFDWDAYWQQFDSHVMHGTAYPDIPPVDEINAEYQRALDRIVVESLIRSTPGVKL